MNEKVKQIIAKIKEMFRGFFKKKTNLVWLAVSIACFLVVILGIVWVVGDELDKKNAQSAFEELAKHHVAADDNSGAENSSKGSSTSGTETEDAASVNSETEEEKSEPVDPYEKIVDFDMLQSSVDNNIHGWIYIPGTMIDYPILQHPSDNTYYLNHNLDGSVGLPACIYTENYNAKDFSDFNTVIYGHNMKNGTMFADVHKFVDSEYVKEHPYIYIYMPGKMCVYEICAVYENDDAHLIATRDMANSREFAGYLEEIKVIASTSGYYNSEIALTEESKIITLSTCIRKKSEKRLLLQAVLCE